jgi:O-acetyl-ADP-ribose deacetylase (regulator of RNase III)
MRTESMPGSAPAPDELRVKQSVIRLLQGDITDLEIEAFVYYARPDLALGSGFGSAISLRGGPQVQVELKKLGPLQTGEAVVTGAGTMKAKQIIHAVGPRFQEEDTEGKLRATVLNALKRAEEKHIKRLAFPAMGTGFYGVPLDLCAKVILSTVKKYLESSTSLEEVVFCLNDLREYKPFQERLKEMGGEKP